MAKIIQPRVLFEDNHLLILYKPNGWLVQGDETGDTSLTDWGREYIRKKYNKPGEAFLHPTHRLDRPVSGIVVFARTSKALERMNKLFHDDHITKTYLAAVKGRPEEDEATLIHWLAKDTDKNIAKAYNKPKGDAKQAELSYELQGTYGDLTLLKVTPKTGRPHQIRVQLAKIDCPIKGDLKYGFPHANPDKSIHLHAYRLEFMHPVKKEPVKITCKPNWDDFRELINDLAK